MITEQNQNRLLLVFFFLSGVSALIYEIVWLRVLGLVFGNTAYAASTVLSAYMAGLGLGAYYFGRKIDGEDNPVRLYGFLEGGVAVYAFVTPFIWKLIEQLNIGFHSLIHPTFIQASFFRFVISFVALFLPTFLMGGTFPVLCKYWMSVRQKGPRSIGFLYALNTFGAGIGVFLSGFFLIYKLGVWQSAILAGIINILIFAGCIFYFKQEPSKAAKDAVPQNFSGESKSKLLLILFALSGAATMIYEVGWTRVFAITLGSSVYSFSIMLIAVLIGIALGSYFYSLVAHSIKHRFLVFVILQGFAAVSVLIGLHFFDDLPFYFSKLFSYSHGSEWLVEIFRFGLCAALLFPPTICLGASFPCFIDFYKKEKELGSDVGVAYLANTIGAILGSFSAGFILIPLFGIQSSIILGAQLNLLIGAGLILFWPSIAKARRIFFITALLVLIISAPASSKPWDKSLLTSGAMMTPQKIAGIEQSIFLRSLSNREVLYYKEGASSIVSVVKVRDLISLAVNGKTDASNSVDAFNQFLLGHLPLFLEPDAKKVLVIGLGSGSTVAAVAAHEVRSIDVVEIEKAVVKGADFFSDLNRNVLSDPRVNLIVDDGRNYLLVHPERYDVIISEPSNPWIAGVANLFSKEHYELMKKRLTKDGIVCQWLHAYSMSRDDLKMIIATFNSVFPDAMLWSSRYPDLLLIGRVNPKPVDFKRIRSLWQKETIRQDFKPFGFLEPESIFAHYFLGKEELSQLISGARFHTDNHPYLEFSAPRYLYKSTLKDNYLLLNSFWKPKYPNVTHLETNVQLNPKFHGELAKAYLEKDMDQQAMVELEAILKLNPQDPNVLFVAGVLSSENSNWKDAQTYFEQAVRGNPSAASFWYYLGSAYQKNAEFLQATDAYQKAIDLDPDNQKYMIALANLFYERKELSPALYLYDRALKIDLKGLNGLRFDALNQIFQIIYEIGDTPRKITAANSMIEKYPNELDAYIKLGTLYETVGSFSEALAIYRKAIQKFPYETQIYLNLARLYDQMGKVKESKKALRHMVKLTPSLGNHPELKKIIEH